MSHNNAYSELLHNAAEEWGLEVMDGRPLIGLPPASDPLLGISGNPYQPDQIPPAEKITEPKSLSRVDIFTFNSQWGFSASINHHNGGYGWGNFIKFCKPYPDKMAALTAAANYVEKRADPQKDKTLIKWAKNMLLPKQLSFI